jgi:hypothetical protein
VGCAESSRILALRHSFCANSGIASTRSISSWMGSGRTFAPGGQTIRLLVHQAAGYSVVCRRAVARRINLPSQRFGSLPGQAEVGILSYSDEQRTGSRPQQQHALLFGTVALAYECRRCGLQSNRRPLGERRGTVSIPFLYREKLPCGAPGTSQPGPLPCCRPNCERSIAR